MSATSSVLKNPIKITSGFTDSLLMHGSIRVNRARWELPSLSATSNLCITKRDGTGVVYLDLTCQTSGESIDFELHGQQWIDPYVKAVPTGTLYLYLK